MGAEQIRVLIVEDDPKDQVLTRRALSTGVTEAYQLVLVDSLAHAKGQGQRPDIVVADPGLPDCHGTDTVVELSRTFPAVPIVVLTGADEREAHRYLEVGAQDYISKNDIAGRNLPRVVDYALLRSREGRVRELSEALERYGDLGSDGGLAPNTRRLSGAQPLRDSDPAAFEALFEAYKDLVDHYLGHLVTRTLRPSASMFSLASRLGALGCGPRDLIDLHLAGLKAKAQLSDARRAHFMATEGRLLALEMMGLLVDYYRRVAARPEQGSR